MAFCPSSYRSQQNTTSFMNFKRCLSVLPCHSLEDFPTFYRGQDADSLLANWTFMWHPKLIQVSNERPTWCRPDQLSDQPDDSIFLIPTIMESDLPFGFQRRVEKAGGKVLNGFADRPSLQQALSQDFEDLNSVQPSTAQAFFALGYAFLQVQLMTRQLRGSSNLDEDAFDDALIQAANSIEEHSSTEEVENPHLQRCFDLLVEEKNCFYPVQSSFVELVLTNPEVIERLASHELQQPAREQNWLVTGETIRTIKKSKNDWSEFSKRIHARSIQLIGGLDREKPFRLLPPESLVNSLLKYQQQIVELVEEDDSFIFAQFAPGLTPHYPSILESTGFAGALHMRFEPVAFPTSSTGNIRWEGDAAGGVLALTEEPKDASRGDSFLRLGLDIGEQIDSAHLSTIVFAHWPGQAHFAFQDLLWINQFGHLFGRSVLLSDYFEDVYDPGYPDDYSNSEYSFSGLKTALNSNTQNPISTIRAHWQQTLTQQQTQIGLTTHVCSLDNAPKWATSLREQLMSTTGAVPDDTEPAALAVDKENAVESRATPELTIEKLLAAHRDTDSFRLRTEQLPIQFSNFDLPKRLVHIQIEGESTHPPVLGSSSDRNPQNGRIALSDHSDGIWDLIVELPGYGATILEHSTSHWKPPSSPKVADNPFLRNEFFEVEIDSTTGGIRGINLHQRRNNLLSQRLSLRTPTPAQEVTVNPQTQTPHRQKPTPYIVPVCNRVDVLRNNRVLGVIQTQSSIFFNDSKIGECTQTMKLTRGSRVLDVSVEVDIEQTWTHSPVHYFCSRLAWKHESEELLGGIHGLRSFIAGQFAESPTYFELVHPAHQITLLTGGLPFHRRSSSRTLDSILIASGETQTSFRFGIGVNLPFGELASREFLTSPFQLPADKAIQSLLHINSRHLLLTHTDWLTDETEKIIGCKLWVREIQGKSGNAKITCRNHLAHATRVDFKGTFLFELETNQNTAMFNFQPFEFGEIHLYWKS